MTRQPRSSRDLKRPQAKREPYDRVLIVCEGSKTEPTYFNELKAHYGLSSANIAITPANGSDPMSVVNLAKQQQQKERKQGDKYDRVYCVFGRG
ncbi:MAG: RloB family protein [Shewanella sp.]|uniref:RloB family protein n=1 Tax=Shewanella sp. TaxID=50422 RepID=UPI003F36C8A3